MDAYIGHESGSAGRIARHSFCLALNALTLVAALRRRLRFKSSGFNLCWDVCIIVVIMLDSIEKCGRGGFLRVI
jgi:hypothetical protein